MSCHPAGAPTVRTQRRTTLTNVACAKCDALLCYTPKRWLYCPRCPRRTKLGTK